jgi:hypothetical protein
MTCKENIEIQEHIFNGNAYPKRNKLKSKYFLELLVLLENHQTNESTKVILMQNIKNLVSKQPCNFIHYNSTRCNKNTEVGKTPTEQERLGPLDKRYQ